MGRRDLGVLAAIALLVSACGIPISVDPVTDPDAAVLQIRSEGGFAPVEWVLGRGPTYTLLADGRLIYEGPMIEIYPGPLVPNYQVGELDESTVTEIRELIDEIGLPGFDDERDDSAASHVADATTEVVTYWDENGAHVFSVYALGIDGVPMSGPAEAFADLVERLGAATATMESSPYLADEARIVAGVSMINPDPEFVDIRDWPLEDDLEDWTELENGWLCTTAPGSTLELFADATQVTQWRHPDEMMDAPVYSLLVRPLLPGEEPC
jgi:hypothetical protein